MLKVIEYGKDEYEFPALLVLGCFDAIHLGHKELLKKAKLQAKINGLDLGVMLFKDGKGGKLVYTFEERLEILEQFNVKFVVAIDFNEEFKAIAPLDFLHNLEDKINVKAYMSGKDFRFGAQAKGKSSTLKSYAEDEENGVWYMPIKDVDLDGEKISTTQIKDCLDAGNVAKAAQLLGTEFCVTGEVVKGEGRGTSVVGFPTVNIVYPKDKYQIKYGVYNVRCQIGEFDYHGVANFGTCPTFGDTRVALEVYFEDFNGDLYGQVLTIRFVDFIREIKTFDEPTELADQLKNDIEVAETVAVLEKKAEDSNSTVHEVKAGPEPIAERQVETQPAVEEDDEIEEPLKALPPLSPIVEEPVEEVKAEEPTAEKVEEADTVLETESEIEIIDESKIDFSNLDSGFDDEAEVPAEDETSDGENKLD